ncbi:YceI family protein [Marivirga sp. S37H4]|uniref:YceI family protein n=2 Tax=Marivirga aurantiaca TaxID=2802615 RepID=A0A935C8Q6_9BACT|nr:YceI family protein [Marivirga aurantiaca]
MGKHQSDAQKVVAQPAAELTRGFGADTLSINTTKSKIDWIATEMRGAKSRTGKISLIDGYFLTTNNEIAGGKFIVDMETMDVTDMPVHEKIALKNLINHLKSDDFFNVAFYPVSILEITSVESLETDSLKISGNLSIREITRNIEFVARQNEKHFTAQFTFNRLDWNIAYEGSWADKTLIDKEVELSISVYVD